VPELSRAQLLVYGAIAVAVLLVGARWVRSGEEPAAADGGGSLSFEADGFEPGADATRDVVVHVAGAVGSPGVYRLPLGARVADAVQRAGGLDRGAAEDGINLAARLSDGQQVVVPGRDAAVSGTAAEGPISLGSATVDQLDEIEGIGPVTAQNIIEFRDQKGGLSSIDQLDEISGIGPSTMEALRAGLQP
jgi:competence protein ComEA